MKRVKGFGLGRATRFRSGAVLVLFSLVAQAFAADGPQDPLWRKAVAVSRANAEWVPGLVVTRMEVLNDGKAEGIHEVWQRTKLGTNGQVITQTVKVIEDGKDVTAKEKGKNELGPVNVIGSSVFNPKIQDQVAVKATERAKQIAGKECLAYEFQQKGGKGPTLRGTAWLEKESGRPVELENMTLDPLPDKHMKRISINARYEATPEGAWQLKETVMNTVVGVLFIKADVRSTMTFSEYWRKPKRHQDKAEKRTE